MVRLKPRTEATISNQPGTPFPFLEYRAARKIPRKSVTVANGYVSGTEYQNRLPAEQTAIVEKRRASNRFRPVNRAVARIIDARTPAAEFNNRIAQMYF